MLLEIAEQEGQLLELLRALLAANRDVTGIFTSNDYLALAAMKAARGLGMRIPQDLSIVGFDGISTGLMVEPNLATVVTDPAGDGRGGGTNRPGTASRQDAAGAAGSGQDFQFPAGRQSRTASAGKHRRRRSGNFPAVETVTRATEPQESPP